MRDVVPAVEGTANSGEGDKESSISPIERLYVHTSCSAHALDMRLSNPFEVTEVGNLIERGLLDERCGNE